MKSSILGVDYTKLRNLLVASKWKDSDQETSNVMLWVARPHKECYLDSESTKRFPCQEIRTIDQLWLEYSNGRFGFGVQNRILESVNRDLGKFGNCVGWCVHNSWLKYSDFTFILNAPKAHLPAYVEVLGLV